MAIAEYLNAIINAKNKLKTILSAKGVEVTDEDKLNVLVNKVEEISASESEPIEKVLYSFGVLSDIHLKDNAYGTDETSSISDYQRALTFYKNNNVDFVAVAGDIVANNRTNTTDESELISAQNEWVSELNLFTQYNSTYFPNKPVYACVGNHDATPHGFYEGENLNSIRNELDGVGLGQLVSSYGDGTKTAEQVWGEILGRPINFVVEHNNDVLVFFSMYYWYYSKFCRNADVAWLEEQLEANKDKRVFLFFHLPIVNTFDPSGQGAGVEEAGFPSNYNFGQLVSKYKNVIYFNGHTHYDLALEATDENFINAYQNGEGMTQVHCSSGAYTRLPVYDDEGNYSSYSNEEAGSQGYLVDVYSNKVVIKGIDFTLGNGGAFIPSANYVVSTLI